MLGAILGLVSAATQGANNVVARRGLLRASANYFTTISVFSGVPFFLMATAVTGDIFRLGECSWQAYLFFALFGVVDFAFGRICAYRSIQLIGATRSNIVTSMNFIVTVVLAMAIFGEAVTPLMTVGIFLALSGPILITAKEPTRGSQWNANRSAEVDRRTLYKGILYGVGAAFFWGSSAIFVKLGLNNGGPPLLGNLVAYLAACIVISPSSFLGAENRKLMFKTSGEALRLALLSGLINNAAHMLRFLALQYGSVIVVSLMGRTVPLWLLLFTFAFNREYESLSRWVLLGNGILMIGSLLALFS